MGNCLFTSSIGRKLIMSISGLFLVLFLFLFLSGSYKIYNDRRCDPDYYFHSFVFPSYS